MAIFWTLGISKVHIFARKQILKSETIFKRVEQRQIKNANLSEPKVEIKILIMAKI